VSSSSIKHIAEANSGKAYGREFLGSFQACWDKYVVNQMANFGDEDYSLKEVRRGYTAYAMRIDVADRTWLKIGIAGNPNHRLQDRQCEFPIGDWTLLRVVQFINKHLAGCAETAMLVSCREFLHNPRREWLSVPDEYKDDPIFEGFELTELPHHAKWPQLYGKKLKKVPIKSPGSKRDKYETIITNC
jgi:hypothetical protein